MAKSAPMKFVGLTRETQYLDDNRRWQQHDRPQITLQVATPSGQVRSIPLDHKDLLRLFRLAGDHVAAELKDADTREAQR